MRSMVEGFFGRLKNPSTTLRVVPLPRKNPGEDFSRSITISELKGETT
jgi:hypothetical protein